MKHLIYGFGLTALLALSAAGCTDPQRQFNPGAPSLVTPPPSFSLDPNDNCANCRIEGRPDVDVEP
jgi:hypothetical protein